MKLIRCMWLDCGAQLHIRINTKWLSDLRWRWKCWRRGWEVK